MPMMKKSLIIIISFVFCSNAFAVSFDDCASHVKKGKEIYQTNCFTCHGEKGQGKGPAGEYLTPKPRNFSKIGTFTKGTKVQEIFDSITKGLEGTSMVSYAHLSEPDRKSVTCYVYTSWVKPAVDAAKKK